MEEPPQSRVSQVAGVVPSAGTGFYCTALWAPIPGSCFHGSPLDPSLSVLLIMVFTGSAGFVSCLPVEDGSLGSRGHAFLSGPSLPFRPSSYCLSGV